MPMIGGSTTRHDGRDAYILKPLRVETPAGRAFWDPLTGKLGGTPAITRAVALAPRRLKGRAKASATSEAKRS